VKLTVGLIHLRHNNTHFVRSLATKTPSASSSATKKPEQTGAQQQRTTTAAASGTSSSDKTSKLQKNRIN